MSSNRVGMESHEYNILERIRDYSKVNKFDIVFENFFHIQDSICHGEVALAGWMTIDMMELINDLFVIRKSRVSHECN